MKWSKGKVEKNWGEICVVNVFLTMLYVKILTLTFYTLKKTKPFLYCWSQVFSCFLGDLSF